MALKKPAKGSALAQIATSLMAIFLLYGCNGTGRLPTNSSQPELAVPVQCQDEAQVLAAQQSQARKVEVTVGDRVFKVLPDDREGLTHQRFLLKLNNGTTVLVAHDTSIAPHVPLSEGDCIRIHGEYIWNSKGGVIHWTHHSNNGRHEPGWIELHGQRYN